MKEIFKRSSYLIILFTVVLSTKSLYGQNSKFDKSIIIGGAETTNFYVDDYNNFVVMSTKESIQNLVIKSSQGKLTNVDSGINNGFLWLTNLELGKVTIRVYKHTKNGLKLLNQRTLPVIKKPITKEEKAVSELQVSPQIDIKSYTSGSIPLDTLKKATKFNINKPYKISHITAALSNTSKASYTSDVTFIELKSQDFNEDFLHVINFITEGTTMVLTEIEILDSKGSTFKLDDILFTVK